MPTARYDWPEDAADPDFEVRFRWEMHHGRPECVALEVISMGGAPIRPATLRAITLSSLVRRAYADEAQKHAIQQLQSPVRRAAFLRDHAGLRPSVWTEQRLGELVMVWTSAIAAGDNPRKEVATHFNISEAAAAKALRRARRLGLLPQEVDEETERPDA